MKIKVGELRQMCQEAAKVTASPEYMKKERVREAFQHAIAGLVASGDVKSDDDLQAVFAAADMSIKALKMIPFDVWQKLASKR